MFAVFDPTATLRPTGGTPGSPSELGGVARVRAVAGAVRDFYRDRRARVALLVTSLVLCYGGGAVMFWFHAVALQEGGPAISWYVHWLLDSTFAFIALTPALVLIIPFASWAASRLAASDPARQSWLYVTITAGLFALVTVPGPVAHDLIVGRGTWVADRLTNMIGDPSAQLAPAAEYPLVAAFTQQLGAAVPTYLVGTAIALVLVRGLNARRPATAR